MTRKVPVIMLQPMGGMGISYTAGEEVVVPQYVADAWAAAQIAKPKGGKASPGAKLHPYAIPEESSTGATEEGSTGATEEGSTGNPEEAAP